MNFTRLHFVTSSPLEDTDRWCEASRRHSCDKHLFSEEDYDIFRNLHRPTEVGQITLHDPIAEFLTETSDCHGTWKLGTILNVGATVFKKVPQRLFCIPSTSASSERVFSKSGLLMSPLRPTTRNPTLGMATFLKSNFRLLGKPVSVAKAVELGWD